MRILHTSDWHLGHTLHDVSREREHELFLEWLLEAIGAHGADALLIAGDVFDTANPPAAAQAMFYRFVAKARRRYERLEIVAIGGNHDSADRLDAPSPLLDGFDVRVVGGLARRADRSLDLDRLILPLRDREGEVRAWVAAVPFLRPADLPAVPGADDQLVEGVRATYREVLDAVRERRRPGQAIVAMGHLYMTGTRLSELSERRILGGNQHALPAEIFPDDVAYAALGHLHLAQQVGRPSVRYSGSPIPLSMSELDYPHQVCLVDLEGEGMRSVEPLRVPRFVELLRVPRSGALEREALLEALRALPNGTLPEADGADAALRPFLEVRVRQTRPDPSLRRDVEQALEGKAARLVKLGIELGGDGKSLADRVELQMLDELLPEKVFEDRWKKEHPGEPPPDLMAAFLELVGDVQQGRAS
ncbi:exonuclease SbcCD subunit D C-terminal domain-containing protein [Vulgatibacter incomptus]|uniref:Nuclease SbcCD subunit D n=1 Tax=Vulgatibacter incomptus TaxID=1391653 RepID=A0A0K1PI87_9BACT|nr:exonuclease SbcCD subunit D C-terminal domain-containing protein [Vulgatibacter incomptus]AKU93131.1 Exonuclease SbcD [Vulgatibacter incomptus]